MKEMEEENTKVTQQMQEDEKKKKKKDQANAAMIRGAMNKHKKQDYHRQIAVVSATEDETSVEGSNAIEREINQSWRIRKIHERNWQKSNRKTRMEGRRRTRKWKKRRNNHCNISSRSNQLL